MKPTGWRLLVMRLGNWLTAILLSLTAGVLPHVFLGAWPDGLRYTVAAAQDEAEQLYARGQALADRLDYPGAIQAFDEAIRLNPRYAEAYNARGIAYSRQGD